MPQGISPKEMEEVVKKVIRRHQAAVEHIQPDVWDVLLRYHARGVCLPDCPLCEIDREAISIILLTKMGFKIGDTDV